MTEVIGIDHIYMAVSDMAASERFYDLVLGTVLGFRKNRFILSGDPHIQYYNRHFGYVLRPAAGPGRDEMVPGLHHLCFRIDSIAAVQAVASQLREAGIEASEAKCYPEYAPDYWATFFRDPDGTRLEVTNYRQERRDRYRDWERME